MKTLTGIRNLGIISVFAICAGVVFAAMPACADLKIVMHTSMDGPMMQNLPPAAKAQVDSMMQSTMYVGDKKCRVNTAIISVMIDPENKKMTMINDTDKTYSVMPYNPAAASAMMQASPGAGMMNAPGASYEVKDTGETATILGHKARHYIVTSQVSMGNMGAMTIHSDTWAAQDLPAADMDYFNLLQAAAPGKVHVEGVPIKTVTTTSGGPMGSMTITQEATAISTSPLPASVFDIPSGYTQSQSPGMMGGGMPGAAPPPAQ